MPHAVEEEESGLSDFLAGEDTHGIDLEAINERDLDVGEKANDAEDYGDISDEDLAEDETEPEPKPVSSHSHSHTHAHALNSLDAEQDPFDDLFGDDELPSPTVALKDDGSGSPIDETQLLVEESVEQSEAQQVDSEDEDPEAREQRLLFEQAQREREERNRRLEGYGEVLPPPPATDAELFSAVWPQFEADKPPRFGELLPGRKAYYPGRKPLKPPKPVHPTKVNLDIQQDQEKSFRLPGLPYQSFQARKTDAEARGIVLILDTEPEPEGSDDEEGFGGFETSAPIGGVTWQDLVALCQDWDLVNEDSVLTDEDEDMDAGGFENLFDDSDGMDDIENPRPSKRRKRHHKGLQEMSAISDLNIALEDPEKATAKLAKKVHLDMNDPNMLIDVQQPVASRTVKRKFKRDAAGGFTKDLSQRYNISNDEAYELLKENHQSRIRSLIGNVKIEHAMPALKLQYPFYKVTLSRAEARSWHRPALALQSAGYVVFAKPAMHKKKHMRGRAAPDVFATAADITMGDNSNMLLLEYSEEYPAMLSSFGMGNRLINYYRRKDDADTARPKLDIGETSVLLPQDKSPFSKFGNVDPGQIIPTISNEMYRAPVFKHNPNQRDFLISRNTTSVEGPRWVLRNIENLHVAGQEFPNVHIPGPNARKVTDAAKQRHKMFAFRMHKKGQKVTNDLVMRHNPGWDTGTARTKMREFMNYDKNNQEWLPRVNDGDLEEPDIRALLKPNEVSLLYSMQVGDRQLQDAGYDDNNFEDGLENEDGEKQDQTKPGQSLNQQLAPWEVTKNFLTAAQEGGMVAIHGEGDPTGRGEAFSFIKTSMKGGFREIGESIEDRLDAKKQKELGGHKYNVAKQNKAYEAAIRRVWEAQSRSLSSTVENDDTDIDVDEEGQPTFDRGKTPNSVFGRSRIEDDSVSASAQSRTSSMGQSGQVLRITRHVKGKYTGTTEVKEEIIRDSKVIRQYVKRRRALDIANLKSRSLGEMKRTGDGEKDAATLKMMRDELERLNRNKDRRHVREKAKGIDPAGSPEASAMSPDGDDGGGGSAKRRNVTGMTARKCANCGQVGHIKTNKKLCPMLNGTIKPDETFGDSAFGSIASTSVAGTQQSPGNNAASTPFNASSPPG